MMELGPNWLPSAQLCESCSKKLYKIIFHPGQEALIQPTGHDHSTSEWAVKRAFTCQPCQTIYYPEPGFKVTQQRYVHQFSDQSSYTDEIKSMSMLGTLNGRRDH